MIHDSVRNRQTLTDEGFRALAAGYGDPATIQALCDDQFSKRRLLVAEVIRRVPGWLREAAGLDAATQLLIATEASRPAAVRVVLGQPHIDAWATLCLRNLARVRTDANDRKLATDLGHLCGIAAAAAIRGGMPFSISVPALAGEVCLPGVGVAEGCGEGRITVSSDGLHFALKAMAHDPVWRPLRAVTLEPGYAIAIEDQNPYRDCYQWPLTSRLGPAEAALFEGRLIAAWRVLVDEHPAHAAAMRIALRAVVPLRSSNGRDGISAASRQAAGSVALALPKDAHETALLLLHEFMHAKLGGLLDVVELCENRTSGRFHAPWRLDPRPPEALLQGIYAHLGVTEFWRMRRRLDRHNRDAQIEFAYWRTQNSRAINTLTNCGQLTDSGRMFADGLRATLRAWQDESVAPDIAAGAEAMVAAQRARWRLANLKPDEDEVRRLIVGWLTGEPVLVDIEGTLKSAGEAVPARLPRLVRAIRDAITGRPDDPDPADAALIAGDLSTAVRGYLHRLDSGDSSDDAWVGLVVAAECGGFVPRLPVCRGSDGAAMPAADVLRHRPDLLKAAVESLGGAPSPTELLLGGVWARSGGPSASLTCADH